MPQPPLIDRLIAPLWARELVRIQPGMGWMLIEIIPVVIWAQTTGAQSLDGYYLVQLLKSYGADDRTLAFLPIVGYGGSAVTAAAVFLQRSRDPKRAAMQLIWPGRALWLGTILWPLLCWWLGLGTGILLGGVFVVIFLCQLLLISASAQWLTWTQGLVPRHLTGRFHAWRLIAANLCAMAALQLVGWTYPGLGSGSAQAWLMSVFAVATLLCLIGGIALQLAPAGPATATVEREPLRRALTRVPGIRRLLAWTAINIAVLAIALPYLPRWLDAVGILPGGMARAQSFAFLPGLLVGVLCAGRLWNRIGGGRGFLILHLLMLGGDLCILTLSPANAGWLLLPALAISGFAKGVLGVGFSTRMQELFPGGDPRVPALAFGIGGLAGACVGGLLLLGYAPIAAWIGAHPGWPAVPWCLLAAAAGMRLLATPLALPPRRIT